MKSLAIAVITVLCCFLAFDSIRQHNFNKIQALGLSSLKGYTFPVALCDTDSDCQNKFGGNGDPEPAK